MDNNNIDKLSNEDLVKIIKKYKTLWFNDEMFIIEHQE